MFIVNHKVPLYGSINWLHYKPRSIRKFHIHFQHSFYEPRSPSADLAWERNVGQISGQQQGAITRQGLHHLAFEKKWWKSWKSHGGEDPKEKVLAVSRFFQEKIWKVDLHGIFSTISKNWKPNAFPMAITAPAPWKLRPQGALCAPLAAPDPNSWSRRSACGRWGSGWSWSQVYMDHATIM